MVLAGTAGYPGEIRLPDNGPGTTVPHPPLPEAEGELIHLQFLARAAERPGALALRFDGGAWTYGELEARTAAFAAELHAAGLRRGGRVAVVARRGPEIVAAMLGASRLGATFILLDSAYPDARIQTLTGIAAPTMMVSAGDELHERVEALAAACGLPCVRPSYGTAPGERVSGLDEGSPDAPAYFLFTSGSTGQPKCVAVSHRPLSHFVRWQAETFGLAPDDRFTMLGGLSHDPMLRDVFTPLSLGASVAIPRQSAITEPGALAAWFHDVGASVAHLTPAMGQVLAAGSAKTPRLPRLRHLFWGSDKLKPSVIEAVARLAPKASHTNFYGSTETPQAAAWFRYDGKPWAPSVPIGKGAHGFEVMLVDADRRPIQDGEGEIAIRSNYLSLGYVRDGALVAPDDRGADGEGRRNIYYTGDRGRRLPDGSVMVLGRADDQVKVRGYRIELAEITAALTAHPAVADGLTLASGEGAELRILAFAATGRRAKVTADELQKHLAGRLPAYMAPSAIVLVEALPLLPNGKVDRQALLALAAPAPASPGDGANNGRTELERRLIDELGRILGSSRVTRESTFAALGGDSLSYVQAYVLLEELIGVVPAGWPEATIADLAAAARKRSRFWSVIDTPMVIRAAAIVLVVSGHLQLIRYDDGGTTALFLVSDFLFGGLQLREAFRQGSAGPILKSFQNILLPTWLYAVFAFTQKTLRGLGTTPAILLLTNDFIDYRDLPPGHTTGNYQIHLWYVDALLQILLFVALGVALMSRLRGGRARLIPFAIGLFLLGCATRFVLPGLWEPTFFHQRVHPIAVTSYLPTTHLATFMLGVLIANAENLKARWLLTAVAALYAAATIPFYGLANAGSVALAGMVLLWASRVPVPKPFATLALTLSGASLFIYLLHYTIGSATRSVIGPNPLLEVGAALVGGVIASRTWLWLTPRIGKFLRRRPGRGITGSSTTSPVGGA